MQPTTYNDDREFIAQHTKPIELADSAQARVLITPGWQARVMTSTLSGDTGPGFGWLNRPFIRSRTDNPKFNNYGGEDRFWLGPEAGQFGLWFRPGNKFTLDDFQTPAGFNSGAFAVESTTPSAVTLTREFEVTNYSGTRFHCGVRRTLRLLDAEGAAQGLAAPIPASLRWVGFESVNTLINIGREPWRPDTGLLCIWILGMFNPLPHGRVIAPFVPGDDAKLGPPINPYFGAIPAERLKTEADHAWFTCDGACRTKIGLSPRRTRNAIGSWDPDTQALTIATFNLPAAPHRLPYVNSQWEIQENPYGGDVVNSYNDGRDPITGTVLGPFYELETSSPAAALAPGERLVHVHRTFHLTGPRPDLVRLSAAALGVPQLPA